MVKVFLKKKWYRLSIIMMTVLVSSSFVASCGEDSFDFDVHEYETVDEYTPEGSPGDKSMIGYYIDMSEWENYYKPFYKYAGQHLFYRRSDVMTDEELSSKEYKSVPEGGYVSKEFMEWDYIQRLLYLHRYDCGVNGYRIVDEHTIYRIKGHIYDRIENKSILLDKADMEYQRYDDYMYFLSGYERYNIINWTLYCSIDTVFSNETWQGRYSMNGSTMIVRTDEKEWYIDGEKKNSTKGHTINFTYKDGMLNGLKKIDLH